MAEPIFRTAVRILRTTVAIVSNRLSLLPSLPPPHEVKSLLSDFRSVDRIPYSAATDGRVSVMDMPMGKPSYRLRGTGASFRGPWIALAGKASDLRFSLWGNQGFLYRFALFLLEKKHRVFSLHACALCQDLKNKLFVVAGGPGSGKTVYLLSGLEQGLSLFSTETVHFKLEGGRVRWFMGSLLDNVRLGTLRHHFPRFLPKGLASNFSDEWQEKVALDLSSHKSQQETLLDPEVIILFPRIEEGVDSFVLNPIQDCRKAAKALFDNLSQKLAESVVLYDRIPLLGMDNPGLAAARLQVSENLVRHAKTQLIASSLSGPRSCWGNLLGGDIPERR